VHRVKAPRAAHNYTRSITGERPPKEPVRSSRLRRKGVQLSPRRSVSHVAQYESFRSVLLEPSVPGLAQSHVRTSTAALGLHGCLQCFPGSCALDQRQETWGPTRNSFRHNISTPPHASLAPSRTLIKANRPLTFFGTQDRDPRHCEVYPPACFRTNRMPRAAHR
jgi:hypothetical protein